MKKLWLIGFALCVLCSGVVAYGVTSVFLKTSGDRAFNIFDVHLSLFHPAPHPAPKNETSLFKEEAALGVPHKALYKVELVERNSSAQVVNISGEMYFEWKPVCGAWTTNHRFNILYEYADNPQLRMVSDFTTYEQMNGSGFDFNSRRRRNGELYEELRGHAVMSSDGGAGEAEYTLPDTLQFDLPPGTLFPMAHSLAVLKAAREGKTFSRNIIFDGSDQEGPAEVNTFIGPVFDTASLVGSFPGAVDKTLLTSPARHVRLAFFPLSSANPDSDYEMDMVLHENGVISDMRVDYKAFAVTQKLVGLEKLSGENCAIKPVVTRQ